MTGEGQSGASSAEPPGARVSLARCSSYRIDVVEDSMRLCLEPLGGISAFVRPGRRILLKPNLVAARAADAACNTHPHFILAAARLVRAAGGHPIVGDSPALGGAGRVLRRLGLGSAMDSGELPVLDLHTGRARTGGCPGHRVPLARELGAIDTVINLPKLKTHQQIGMTCCVKNLFGCVAGRRKAWLHLALGHDEDAFGAMLVEVARAVAPALNLVDAIVCLERGGPIRGEPAQVGLVAAGPDPVAIDALLFAAAGVAPERVCTHRAAARAGFGVSDPRRIEALGADPREVFLRPLRPPDAMSPISFSPWHIARGWVRQLLARRAFRGQGGVGPGRH